MTSSPYLNEQISLEMLEDRAGRRYVNVIELPLDPAVGPDRIRAALEATLHARSSLRTRLAREDRRQSAEPLNVDQILAVRDLDAPATPEATAARLEALAAPVCARTNNRRVQLELQRWAGGARLIGAVDHMVADADSISLIQDDILRALDGEPLADDGYLQFCATQRAHASDVRAAREVEYWKRTLGEVGPIPGRSLHGPECGVQASRTEHLVLVRDRELRERLFALADMLELSRFMLTSLLVALALTGRSRRSIAPLFTAVSTRRNREARQVAACLADSRPLVFAVEDGETMPVLAARVRRSVVGAVMHNRLDLERLSRNVPAMHEIYFGHHIDTYQAVYSEEPETTWGTATTQAAVSHSRRVLGRFAPGTDHTHCVVRIKASQDALEFGVEASGNADAERSGLQLLGDIVRLLYAADPKDTVGALRQRAAKTQGNVIMHFERALLDSEARV